MHTQLRRQLKQVIDENGRSEDLGTAFDTAERKTNVRISIVEVTKPGGGYENEFEGFFMDEEPAEDQAVGIMPYNVVRDLVNRYVSAVKLFDEQLHVGVRMNDLIGSIRPKYAKAENIGFTCTSDGAPLHRSDFKKNLQKQCWAYIFEQMNMEKYATRGLRDDINKFVEHQQSVPFTMRNVYKMLEIVVGTHSQRMDKAILEAFDNITKHHADNQHYVEGWKTNSHFLLTKKFIVPYMVEEANRYGFKHETYSLYRSGGRYELIEDLEKALCYLMGMNWEEINQLHSCTSNASYGQWYYTHTFFDFKAFKKGTMHFVFKSEEVWAKLNAAVARIKGYPLFEGREQTAYQKRQTGRTKKPAA